MKQGIFFLGLVFSQWHLDPVQSRVLEKTATACNGPCGQMSISCPANHIVAIRDAVYMVQDRGPNCTPFSGCASAVRQDVCCEPTSQDCVFAYSPAHLKVLHRECSGNNSCVIQTERSEVETVTCASTDSQNLASQTALNYVCINDSSIADICSPKEMVVQGKTLFGMINPRDKDGPTKGSVCSCLAESTRWPTTNSIAVFLVDMRLNRIGNMKCSNTSIKVRSGSNEKELTCDSIRDPRINFPFVAVLNDSNVASLRLEIRKYLPEFVWLGFEANEEEDIRLTCKLQGYFPHDDTVTDSPAPSGEEKENVGGGETGGEVQTTDTGKETNGPERKQEPSGIRLSSLPIILGAVGAGVAFILIIIIIIFLILRKRKPTVPPITYASSPDMDLYYSTTDDEIRNIRANRDSTGSTQELYISPDDVRKRKSSSKRVRIISTPDIVEDIGVEYATASEVRDRKRLTQDMSSYGKDNEEDDNYDRLYQKISKPDAAVLASYDQLEPHLSTQEDYTIVEDGKVQGSKFKGQSKQGTLNSAYMETEPENPHSDRTLVVRPTAGAEPGGLYFELEKRPLSTSSYELGEYPKSSGDSRLSSTTSRSSSGLWAFADQSFKGGEDESNDNIYHDGKTERPASSLDNAAKPKTPSGRASVSLENLPKTKGAESSPPVAAPRRKISKARMSAQYDMAKPIQ